MRTASDAERHSAVATEDVDLDEPVAFAPSGVLHHDQVDAAPAAARLGCGELERGSMILVRAHAQHDLG